MKWWEIFIGAVALLSGGFQRISPVFDGIFRIFVVTIYLDENLARALARRYAPRSSSREPEYYLAGIRRNARGGQEPILFERVLDGKRTFWVGIAPLWHDRCGNKTHRIRYLRWTIDWWALVADLTSIAGPAISGPAIAGPAIDGSASMPNRHVVVHRAGNTYMTDGGKKLEAGSADQDTDRRIFVDPTSRESGRSARRGLGAIVLPGHLVDLAEEIRAWLVDEEWYASHDIPWRMGVLLHGMPGTGKTSFIRAIAEELDLPVHVLHLGQMKDEDLLHHWSEIMNDTPGIVLIEDIDTVFHGRDHVRGHYGNLTFDTVLNCVSGVSVARGLLLFVTTNHLDLVDEALRDREGRIDYVIEVGPMGHGERVALARRILQDDAMADQVAIESGATSASAFVEACRRRAIAARRRARDTRGAPYRDDVADLGDDVGQLGDDVSDLGDG